MSKVRKIKLKILDDIKSIKYAFFTKNLKNSTNRYYSSHDSVNDEHINNKTIAMIEINRSWKDLILTNQVHGNNVLVIKNYDLGNVIQNYDAIVTNLPRIVLGIRTADCVPILFVDPENPVIGAAHVGWRGAKNNIIKNTIEEMINIGAKIENIIASIGPCIRQKSYEVDSSFYKDFLDEDLDNKEFFINSMKTDHHMFDLPAYVKLKLARSNIINIHDVNCDTLSDEENFISYRRSCLNGDTYNSNLLSVISLEK